MALGGKAVMINWSDVAPEHRSSYYEWHNREHMITAVAVPGFQRGRRFIALRADRTYFNLYEVDDLGVLTGPDYMARTSRPTELTRRTTQYVRNAIRGLARVRFSRGVALGGIMLTLRMAVAPGQERDLEHYLTAVALPAALNDSPEVLAAHFCVADHASSAVVTPERQGRLTTLPSWVVLIEGVSTEALDRACDAHLRDAALLEHGGTPPFDRGLYRFEMMAMHNAPGA